MKTILAGGGHGHVYVMAQMRKYEYPGEVILISDKRYQYYSGMLSDHISGFYTHEEVSFDLQKLAEKTGITYINETIEEIDNERKVVITDKGEYEYDLLSMDLGSKNYAVDTYSVKPLDQLLEIKKRIEEKEVHALTIIGAGASGVELAFAYDQFAKKIGHPLEITICTDGEIVKDFPHKAKQKIKKELRERGIQLLQKEEETKEGELILQATGPEPNRIRYKGFTIAEDGYLLVDECLRASKDGAFAMGDMIHFEPKNLPKVGVYAIRQSPVLCSNVFAEAKGGTLKEFKPQKKFLGIISFADGTGVAKWGNRTLSGKLLFKLKEKIDRKFMEDNKK